jgi:aquaporin Z
MNRYLAEFVGTLLLVFIGVGTAVFAGKAVGELGISIAFGLVLLAMAYAIGPISGCHINPAVTLGAALAGRMKGSDIVPYWLAQCLGGICGFGFLALILLGSPQAASGVTSMGGTDFLHATAAAVSNGYGDHSPNGYGMSAAFVTETILTFVLVFTVLGATAASAPSGFAGIPIGMALLITNLVGIPITNASINPARSLGPAIYAGGWALSQLWLFVAAPLVGGIIAALVYRLIENRPPSAGA